MMAMSKKMLEQEPSEIEMLLPFHAAGTLSARDARRVEEALARDPELAKQYAVIREEYAETIHLNESLGAPSARAMQKLFAAIDAEPARRPSASLHWVAEADHSFHVLARSGRKDEQVMHEILDTSAGWIETIEAKRPPS